jgi:hypothetical protein
MKTATGFLMVALALSACSNSNDAKTGVGEPLVIKTKSSKGTALAQFIPGSLPGVAKMLDLGTGGSASTDTNTSVSTSLQATLQYSESKVYQGQGNIAFTGNTSTEVSAVGLALENLGTGYWVVPVGAIDGATLLPTWDAIADFGAQIPEGFRNLLYVAIDGNGNAGTLQSQKICIASRVPDGYQGCVANPKTPATVISLSWDTNVDLDLQVRDPAGRLIESKNPATVDLDAGTTLPSDAGRIDRDSNGNCSIDNIRYENLVWQNVAPKGRYGIYVNLFDACRQPSVRFNVQVYSTVDTDAGTKVLQSWYSANGVLLDFQANGGSSIGLFVTEFDFQ